jgi:hypothetical protein|tara:strand:+ start:2816 stop:4729 length:1914 start_codon:yes stop_codon:yes gene_type:complete
MTEPLWYYKKFVEGDHIDQSNNAEFFKTAHIDNLTSALVRESVQNSLDAKLPDTDTVRVSFRIGSKSIAQGFDRSMLNELSKHITASGSPIPKKFHTLIKKNFKYIIIEDFNTEGLNGDVSYARGQLPSEKNDFYFFFRNDGRSGKTSSLGKWGIGKTIFPAISNLHMFWAVTVQSNGGGKYLMGRSNLGNHTIKNTDYVPTGYYGIRRDSNSPLVLPIEDVETIDNFCTQFNLERGDSSGLSIVVPFVPDSITHEKLVHASMIHYMYPIKNGTLEININATGNKDITINADSIDDILDSYSKREDGEKYQKLRLQSDALGGVIELPKEEHIMLLSGSVKNIPQWKTLKMFSKEVLNDCRNAFERGEKLAFIIPIQIHPVDEENKWSRFRLYLERDESLDGSEDIYIRDGLKIPGVSSIGGRNLRGIFIADEAPLTDFLRAAENPAHTEWQQDAFGLEYKFDDRKLTLSFIKNSFARITSILSRPLEDIDVDLLAEFFPYLDSDHSTKKSKKPKRGKKGRKSAGPDIPRIPYIPIARVQKQPDGFRVSRNPDYYSALDFIEVTAAYNCIRGNALKRFHPLDFNFENDDLDINGSGLNAVEMSENRILFKVTEDDFDLVVTGFDENRDLYVKVTKVDS